MIEYTIRYRGAVPGSSGLSQRAWNDLRREAWMVVGRHWHEKFRPKHFTPSGAAEYGYTPRSRSYTDRKMKAKHTRSPLVYSGELQRGARMARITATVTSNKSTCRVALPGARKMNLLPPEMRDELTRVSPAEQETLMRMYDREIDARLKAIGTTETKRM